MSTSVHRIYRLEIPSWRPALANELRAHHMHAHRLKRRDAEAVRAAVLAAGVPRATARRRMRAVITAHFRRLPDPDAPLKSLLDALVRAGAVVDDSATWCVWSAPEFRRGPLKTVIELEDLP